MGWSIDFKQEGGKKRSNESEKPSDWHSIEENVVRYIVAKPMLMQKWNLSQDNSSHVLYLIRVPHDNKVSV